MRATTERLMAAFPEAGVTMLAASATMLCALAIDPEPGPAVMAVVLSVTLSRSHLDLDARGRLEAAFALPLVSLAALGVGALLLHAPWLGALAFVIGMSVSIWLRRFGPLLRRAGSLIALPFVVILTTPYIPTTRASPLMALLIPVIVAELALLWVSAVHWLARRWHWIAPIREAGAPAVQAPRDSTMWPIASSRMAVQMAVALTLAFIVGYLFFAERWAWVVLTAYIVGAGNQGRLDVAYKGVLRFLGAAAGTIVALAVSFHAGSHEVTTVVLMLAAVFLGLWLRPIGYAWWALFVTLALSLLQGFEGVSATQMLGLRLEEIVIGAIIAIASAWFVLPIRSSDVMRRRLADALAALGLALDPTVAVRDANDWIAAVSRVDSVAPAFRALRWLAGRWRPVPVANWSDTLLACRIPAERLIASGQTPAAVRKSIGAARKAMRDPGAIQPALSDLLRALGGALESPTTSAADITRAAT